MHIYLVSPPFELLRELHTRFGHKPDVLISYAYASSAFSQYLVTHRQIIGEIMLDSGAYTEMQGGPSIDLDRYAAYVKGCGHLFNYCINLDTDPANYDIRMWHLARLKSRTGIDVLPVVHDPYVGEIDSLYKQGHRYILIGSSWGNDRSQLDFIFQRYIYSGSFPGMRFHKLGTATYTTLSEYPFYSSDSAGYLQNAGYGRVTFWNTHREPDANGDRTDHLYFGARTQTSSIAVPNYKEYPYLEQFEAYLSEHFDRSTADLEGAKGTRCRQLLNAKYVLELEGHIKDKHGS